MLKIIVPEKDAFQVIDYQIDRPVRGVPHLCVVRSPGCGNLDGYHRLLKFGNSGLALLGNCIVDQGDPMLLHRTCKLLHSRQRLVNQQGDRLFIGVITDRSLRIRSAHFHIGIYTYKDEIVIENAIPPILDKELFYKVQEMLRVNQKAAAHRKAKVDYLLFGKLFCGNCGTMMVGVCGTSKTGARHHYYICPTQKKKLCNKKAVRHLWIENLVLEHTINLLQDDVLLESIAENTYQYYLSQNTETSYTKSLQKALEDTENSIWNLLRAVEAGLFSESTKIRLDELETQKNELKAALAAAKLKENLGLKKEHNFILFASDF